MEIALAAIAITIGVVVSPAPVRIPLTMLTPMNPKLNMNVRRT
jgi:hypothetical protein